MRMLSVSYLPEDCSSLLVCGAPGRMFDASLERLSVTETSYNNSLAERVTRSTIQTLPATLPEPRTVDHGPGLLEPFLCQIWTLLKGVGPRLAGVASQRAGLLDWLAGSVRIRKHRLLRYRKTYDYLMSSDKFI